MKNLNKTAMDLSYIKSLELGRNIVSKVISSYDDYRDVIENHHKEKYYNVTLDHYSDELLIEIGNKFKVSEPSNIVSLLNYDVGLTSNLEILTFKTMESIVDSTTLKIPTLWWNDFIFRFSKSHLIKRIENQLSETNIEFSMKDNSLILDVDKLSNKRLTYLHLLISGGEMDFRIDFKTKADNLAVLEELIVSINNFKDPGLEGFLNSPYYKNLDDDNYTVEGIISFEFDEDGERVLDKLKEMLMFC